MKIRVPFSAFSSTHCSEVNCVYHVSFWLFYSKYPISPYRCTGSFLKKKKQKRLFGFIPVCLQVFSPLKSSFYKLTIKIR